MYIDEKVTVLPPLKEQVEEALGGRVA